MQDLEKRLLALRRLYQSCRRQRKRDAWLTYLTGVYELYFRLKRNSKRLSAAKQELLRFQTCRSRKRHHSIRMLVEATAGDVDVKVKSRWTRCLRFAGRRKVLPK